MPQKEIEEVKGKIDTWMRGRGIFIREIESEETHFQFEGKTETQVGIIIAQPKKLYRSIVVISKLELHPKHLALLGGLNSKKRAEFIWGLKKDLIFAPATFTMEQSGSNLRSIQFAKEISFDELTDGRLIEAVDNVCRPLIWTAWVFVKKFGQPEEIN
ncbi:MAG: hypothetical protein QG588_1488 [Candidatus Poribacteria bacterium]|nr:hypothetical protein [Candidatus Poribacteria bacterium]